MHLYLVFLLLVLVVPVAIAQENIEFTAEEIQFLEEIETFDELIEAQDSTALEKIRDAEIDQLASAAIEQERIDVIITFDASNPEALQNIQEKLASDNFFLRILGIDESDSEVFDILPVMRANVTADDLEELRNIDGVVLVENNTLELPELAIAVPHIGVGTTTQNGHTGLGSVVAILDDGFDFDHPMLRDKAIHQACFTSNSCPNRRSTQIGPGAARPCPDCEHGTAVASIAVGLPTVFFSSRTFQGVAPDADLVAIDVFGNPGSTQISNTIRGLEHVLELKQSGQIDIDVVSMSFGGGKFRPPCDFRSSRTRFAVIQELVDLGVVVVSSAGNTGGNGAGLGSPGCYSNVVSVGATDRILANQEVIDIDEFAVFSNYDFGTDGNFYPTLMAPGVTIQAAESTTSQLDLFSGTSFSTPMVAGAFAVLRGIDPEATREEMLEALIETAAPVPDDRLDFLAHEYPRIQVDAAVDYFLENFNSVCGNGNIERAEACDDGNLINGDGCSSECVVEFCGDSIVQTGIGEECDDGNLVNGDGCNGLCQANSCGDGVLDQTFDPFLFVNVGEECDDGNLINQDGCSNVCLLEGCGDGIVQTLLGEDCDDGNLVDIDACSNQCKRVSNPEPQSIEGVPPGTLTCRFPKSTFIQSCVVISDIQNQQSVHVRQGATLYIAPDVTLDIDLEQNNLKVDADSTVIVLPGARIV